MGDIVFNIKSVVDTAVTNGIDVHTSATDNPHSVTKAQIGLGSVDDTSDAGKPISIATADALGGKVDDSQVLTDVPSGAVFTDTTYSVQDGELSEVSFTTADNSKLDGIEVNATADQTGAEIKSLYETEADTNVFTDADVTRVDSATVLDTAATTLTTGVNEVKSNVDTHKADLVNPHAVTKAQVGLGNADDTSDATKNSAIAELTNKTITSYTNKIHADQLHVRVKCVDADGTLTGQAVMFSGYNSGEDAIEVILADNTVGVAIGLAEEDMANGVFGTITMNGIIEGLDTSDYTEGQILYIGTAGALTATEPSTGFSQPMAFVLRPHSVNGALQVNASYPKQDASDVRNTPAGSVVATTVQDAIAELDAEKFDKTGGAITGDITTTGLFDGRDVSADGTKLDGIEDNATADQTDSELLSAVKNVDGSGSGLDADLLDGNEGSFYQDATNLNAGIISDARLPDTITSDITGNSATATVWQTSRTMSISGDVTGSVVVDGSGSTDTAVTVKDSVVLGGSPTTTTQVVTDESTKVATTQYVVDKLNETEEVI